MKVLFVFFSVIFCFLSIYRIYSTRNWEIVQKKPKNILKKRDSGIGCVGWIFMSIVEFFSYILQAGEFYSIVMMIIIAGFLGLFFVVYGKLIVLIGSLIYMVLLIVFQPAILSYMVKRVIDISAKNEIIVHEGLLTNPYHGKIKISILFGILVALLLCLPLIYIFIKS